MGVADLHVHSSASDGLLSPEEIVNWGVRKGLSAISITDHDNVSAIDSAVKYSISRGIEIIPGLELSTEYKGVEVHILGYFIDYDDCKLNMFLEKLRSNRTERAQKMVRKLNSMGYNISFENVLETAKDALSIGRPHVARTLMNHGYCKSMEEAFERFIGFGKPAYVERYKISPFEAVELISKWNGVSSIAHPGLIINIDKLSLIKKLITWGLSAVEVYHTNHSHEDVLYFKNIVNELHLVATGGTDCHGIMIDNQPMLGNVVVPYANVCMLKSRKRTI